jgi:hypothetical protein
MSNIDEQRPSDSENREGATAGELRGADFPTEVGKRPPHVNSAADIGEVGTGDGYSGQEYDSRGQREWRAEQERQSIDPSGTVHGSGAGAGGGNDVEDYDSDSASGGKGPPTGARRTAWCAFPPHDVEGALAKQALSRPSSHPWTRRTSSRRYQGVAYVPPK